MKARIAVAVAALTFGSAFAAIPSFAQTYNQPSGTAANQPSGTAAQEQACVHFGTACSNKPYPMNNSEQGGRANTANAAQSRTRQSRTMRSAAGSERLSADRERVAQGREGGMSETYRLGERNRYSDYAPGVQVGAAGRGDTEWCAMRFRSYDPATGTYMGFDGVPHACP